MPETKSRKRNIAENALRVLVYLYVAAVIVVWLLIRYQGDRWWLATLLVYGPRWTYFAPLVVLFPAAMILLPKPTLAPLSLCGCIALFSLMGFNVPWRSWGRGDIADLRVLCFNVERHRFPSTRFLELVDREQPDVIAFQECAGPSRWSAWWQPNDQWHAVRRGDLRVASQFPIKSVEISHSRWPVNRTPIQNAIYCVLETPKGDLGFCNVHVETPRRALDEVLDPIKILDLDNADDADFLLECRRLESRDLLEWLSGFPEPKIIAGDFNMTSDSRIYRGDWNQFRDAFVWAGWGLGYTKQTVIRRRQYGLRIDHILSDKNWTPVKTWVGPDLGSDHLPLFAGFAKTSPN